jgi:Bacteriophage head to tail connecting protein
LAPSSKDSNTAKGSALTGGKSRAALAIAKHTALESDALNFRVRWQECSDYIQPRKGNILVRMSPGQPQTINVWDTTAEQALMVYAAGIVSYLTPPSEIWARLEPRDKDASQELRTWFEEATETMFQEIALSQFYEVWHEDNLDGGCFGSSLMRVDEYPDDDTSLLSFTNIPVGTFYWREDNRGRISTITRTWKWSAPQAEEEFGRDALSPLLLKALESADVHASNREFQFIEVLQKRRRDEVTPGMTTAERRPWECLYICVEDQAILREDGHYENPYAGCRVMRGNNEVYGRGPGTQAMPNIKAVNRMKEDVTVITERMAKPSWISPDDTAYDPDNRPDGVTFWDASKGAAYKPEQIQLKNDLRHAKELLDEDRKVIRDYFYYDMFKLLTTQENMKREKTAYEVAQMVAEQMVLFSPIFSRIKTEKLDPIINRIFAVMFRNGRFKQLPAGVDPRMVQFDVAYVSKIALAIKAIQNQSFATALQLVQATIAMDPTVPYMIDWHKALRKVLPNTSVPSGWMRSEAEVVALVQKQQQEQERLQAAQAALAGSQTIKNLGPDAQAKAGTAFSAAGATPRAA